MPAGLSYDQMMRVPYITGLIRRIRAPGNTFSRYYGLSSTSPPAQQIIGRAGQYDIFDGTRSLAPVSAPGAPPMRLNRKPVGSIPITVPRVYNAIGIEDERIFGTRNLGQQYSAPVGNNGRAYFVNQIRYAKQRMDNNHEFMATRMFGGGWAIKPYAAGSQQMVLCEKDDASTVKIVNNSQIPATHLGDLDGLITTSWDDPSANLLSQLFELQVVAARENGRRITDIWVNGSTGKHLFTNTVIQGVGGSVYKIFDTLTPAREIGPNQEFPDTGVTVVFRGLPDYRFHIYNQGFVTPGTSESFAAQISSSNWQPFIPDNVAIFTPPPGDWCGMVEGSEPMQWNLTEGGSRTIFGFGMGTERAIDPPRTDVKMLYNGAPVITEPYAVYQATVIFDDASSA
jgi:hypothetical protein